MKKEEFKKLIKEIVKEVIEQQNSFDFDFKKYVDMLKKELLTLDQLKPNKLISKKDLIILYAKYNKYKRIDSDLLYKIWNILKDSAFRCYIVSQIYYGTDVDYIKYFPNSYKFVIKIFGEKNKQQIQKAYKVIDDSLDDGVLWPYPDKLGKFLSNTYNYKNDEKLFFNIDKLINLIHGNGDAADNFIEGGSETLDYIRDMKIKGISLPQNVNEDIYESSKDMSVSWPTPPEIPNEVTNLLHLIIGEIIKKRKKISGEVGLRTPNETGPRTWLIMNGDYNRASIAFSEDNKHWYVISHQDPEPHRIDDDTLKQIIKNWL